MRLFLTAAAAALITTGAYATPLDATDSRSQPTANIDQVALVCDQYCQCWQTRYQQSHGRKADYRAQQDFNSCPGGGHYNGYYRTGPSIDLDFESRFPVRSHPFPF